MATETLVIAKPDISTEKLKAGEELIRRLDAMKFKVVAALWYYWPEINQWRLIIASPSVDEEGPKKAYRAINAALEKKPNRIKVISLQEIAVTSPNNADVVSMRAAFKTEKGGFPNVRLQGIVVNDVLVTDGFIYRL